jgi:hypothetical protein
MNLKMVGAMLDIIPLALRRIGRRFNSVNKQLWKRKLSLLVLLLLRVVLLKRCLMPLGAEIYSAGSGARV